MASPFALDLSEVDPRVWRVRAGETVYGPYTRGQIVNFVKEGNVAAHTEIAEGVGKYLPAGMIGAFTDVFADAISPIDDVTSTAGVASEPEPNTAPAGRNMVVVLQAAEHASKLMHALSEVGTFVEAVPGTVILKSRVRIAKVQAALSIAARPGDRAIIVDAAENRIAWVGLEPGQDRAVRDLWD